MRLTMRLCNLSAIVAGMLLATAPLALAAPSESPEAKQQPSPPAASTPKPKTGLSAVECEVWNRERSFAASVERHDAKAFAEHVHAQAAFDASSSEPTHGREAIVASWKGIIDGKSIKLGWYPGTVTLGGDGNFAVSSGPDWIEDLQPKPKQHYQIG